MGSEQNYHTKTYLAYDESDKYFGYFKASCSKMAAGKAYTVLRRNLKKAHQDIPEVCTIRLTKDSDSQRMHKFQCSQILLDKPTELVINTPTGEQKIMYRYNHVIKRCT